MLAAVRQYLNTRVAARLIGQTSLDQMDSEWIERVRQKWSNDGYAARHSFVRAIVDFSSRLNAGDCVLDVGSGLSTLVLNRICQFRQAKLYSLEHDPDWYRTMQRLAGDVVHFAPLTSYGDYDWYEVPNEIKSLQFQLVAVDGPPEKTTRGSRCGLLHVMGKNLAAAKILADDYRPIKPWVNDWQKAFSAKFSEIGEFVVLIEFQQKG
jgi:hypothetical protein